MSSDKKIGFAARLKEVMAEQGLTQVELARKVGVTQSAVSLWLQGTAPNRKRLVQIAIHLGLDETWLLDGTGPKVLSPEARHEREEIKTAQAQTVQRLIGSLHQRTKTVVIFDSPGQPEQIFDFKGATEEQWTLLTSQIEVANRMVNQSARASHPV